MVFITGGLEMVVAGEVFLVDHTFYGSCQRCPLAVARLLGKCFRTSAELRPGHVVKKPAVISLVHVETMGMKTAWWMYCIMSDLVERVWTLF